MRRPPAPALAAAALVACIACAACAACGARDDAARPPAAAPAASPPAGPGDVEVARVDGRPVWGSCVAGQLRRGAPTPRAALDECIAFELLAQRAEARGLAGDPEVTAAARRAAASRLVALEFEGRYRAPADLRAVLDRLVDRQRDQLDKPELRASAFARVEVPRGAPPEAEAAARALAERIHAALAGEAGLFAVNLRELAERVAAEAGPGAGAGGGAPAPRVTFGDFRAAAREALVPAYGDALFAIPEVGRVAPPVRTEWGWDLVLLTQLLPPRLYTREEVAAQMFPDVRRQYFQIWVNELLRGSGARIEIAARADELIEEAPGQRPGQPPGAEAAR